MKKQKIAVLIILMLFSAAAHAVLSGVVINSISSPSQVVGQAITVNFTYCADASDTSHLALAISKFTTFQPCNTSGQLIKVSESGINIAPETSFSSGYDMGDSQASAHCETVEWVINVPTGPIEPYTQYYVVVGGSSFLTSCTSVQSQASIPLNIILLTPFPTLTGTPTFTVTATQTSTAPAATPTFTCTATMTAVLDTFTITKLQNGTDFAVNDEIAYVINYTAVGNVFEVSVYDTVPANMTYVTSSPAATIAGPGIVQWYLGTVSNTSGALTWVAKVINCGMSVTSAAAADSYYAKTFSNTVSANLLCSGSSTITPTRTAVIITPTFTETVTYTSTPDPGLPELAATSMDYVRLPIAACNLVTDPTVARVFVQNTGSSAAGSFVVDLEGNTVVVAGLGAGASTTVVFYNQYTPLTSTQVIVDKDSQVAESDEVNNTVIFTPNPVAPPVICTETATQTVTRTITAVTPGTTMTFTETLTRTPVLSTFTPTCACISSVTATQTVTRTVTVVTPAVTKTFTETLTPHIPANTYTATPTLTPYFGTPTVTATSTPDMNDDDFIDEIDDNVVDKPGEGCHVKYRVEKKCKVQIKVFNKNGKLIKVINDRDVEAGLHDFTWYAKNSDEKDVVSGIYNIVIDACGKKKTIKVAVIR